MLLIIHNLPPNTSYVDVTSLLKEKCGLTQLNLDELVWEGATKRVSVGVADARDAGVLLREVNGLYVDGRQLYVEDKRKKPDYGQPYYSSASLAQETWYPEPTATHSAAGNTMASSVNNAMMMNYNMGGYMPTPVTPMDQNMSYMGYGGGFMAKPPVQPRPPAPARSERGFAGFQGAGAWYAGQHAATPLRNNFAPKANENHRKRPSKKAKKPPQQVTETSSNLLEKKRKPSKRAVNIDQNQRGQAAGRLARDVMLTKIGKMKLAGNTAVLKLLKPLIKSRIDAILGKKLQPQNSFQLVMDRYRLKYPVSGDKELFESMRDKVANEGMENGIVSQANTDAVKSETQVKKKAKQPVKSAEINDNGKSKDVKEPPRLKLTGPNLQPKVRFTEAEHYKLDPLTEEIVDEELEKLIDIFASECEGPFDPIEQTICNHITKQSAQEFKQVTQLQLSKRILDIRTGLAIRIYSTELLPRRLIVKEYLKPYKIKKLVKKSNKQGIMYVAHLNNFEDYDRLCYKKNDVIAGVPVSIGSIYLLAPPPKLNKKQIKVRRQQFLCSQTMPTGSQNVPTKSQNLPTSTQNIPAESNNVAPLTQIVPTSSQMESTSQQIKNPNHFNAEIIDLSADDLGADVKEDVNIAGPAEINTPDINDDDLEDY